MVYNFLLLIPLNEHASYTSDAAQALRFGFHCIFKRATNERKDEERNECAFATSDIADAKADEVKAHSAIDLARQYKDEAAEGVVQGALATAQSAEALAYRRIVSRRATADQMKALLDKITPGATGLATNVHGDVSIQGVFSSS